MILGQMILGQMILGQMILGQMILAQMTLELSHFGAALLFSVFASIVFGITQRNSAREQIRYGLYCFAMFVGGVFVAGWVMWLLRR